MTSNLGAAEMGSILRPNLGFAASEIERRGASPAILDEGYDGQESRGPASKPPRRKFTPEFMNRIDKVVVFRPLGQAELRKILRSGTELLQHADFQLLHDHAVCIFGHRTGARTFCCAKAPI